MGGCKEGMGKLGEGARELQQEVCVDLCVQHGRGAEGLGVGVQMKESYPSNFEPFLPVSPLTFWGSWKERLQMAIT